MPNILIAGGTGLIGTALTQTLVEQGFGVHILSRNPSNSINGVKSFAWNPANNEINAKAFEGVECVINLAGAGIADRAWSDEYKKLILESRVQASTCLLKGIQSYYHTIKQYIGASAIGYYGDRGNETLDEQSMPGNGFLPETGLLWEKSHQNIAEVGIPSSIIRIGLVLSKDGGLYPKLRLPVVWGIGGALGKGTQWQSWIHIDDVVGAILFLIQHQSEGVYNLTSPNPITQLELLKEMAKQYNRPFFMPNVPEFILKMVLGEKAALVLDSTKVYPKALLEKGFRFKFEQVNKAIYSLK
jgi:uncharacterized protein